MPTLGDKKTEIDLLLMRNKIKLSLSLLVVGILQVFIVPQFFQQKIGDGFIETKQEELEEDLYEGSLETFAPSYSQNSNALASTEIMMMMMEDEDVKGLTRNVSLTMSEYHHVPIYAPANEKVLGLLFPPGIHGGYRNQVIRLIGLVLHALYQNIHYILLDSLIAVTHLPHEPYVLFEDLFDVDHWNSFRKHLPLLVNYHESSNYTCWRKTEHHYSALRLDATNATHFSNERSSNHNHKTEDETHVQEMEQYRHRIINKGFFAPVYNKSVALISGEEDYSMHKLRRLDLRDQANTCKGNPVPYGGGRMAGELWKEYLRGVRYLERKQFFPFDAQQYVLRALRPKKVWRDLSMSCVSSPKYVGLHMRMEQDMIGHKCGKHMEHNSTRLFAHIDEFLSSSNEKIDTMVVATSRKEMEKENENNHFKAFLDENLKTLNHFTKINSTHALGGRQVSVLECGQGWVSRYFEENPEENAFYYRYLLPMIVDFHILTEATIFIGVRNSSFSNDVWATRYHQGKGRFNYEYTPEGIFPIENDGLPPPHADCKK